MNKIIRPAFKYLNLNTVQETRRFAGHSKWKNIKHQKEERDSERSILIERHLRKMKAVIAETGNTNPETNIKLQYLVEDARKKMIPTGTVRAFFERIKNSQMNSQNLWVNIQGPNGCFLIFHLLTENVVRTKHNINTLLRKHNCRLADDSIKSIFQIDGTIITEKFCDLDKATDIGIEIGAEDVSEIEEDGKSRLKFICNPQHLMVIKTKLEKLGHSIISAEEEYIPHNYVELSDEGMNCVVKIIDRIRGISEVVQIYDNIA